VKCDIILVIIHFRSEEIMMKTLIVYFSATGKTEKAAEKLAEITGGELYEIETRVNYPKSYLGKIFMGRRELIDRKFPKLIGDVDDFSEYDRVFIGFPIWFGTCPMAVTSFLKTHDFTGKVVYPFCTSGSSGIAMAVANIVADCEGDVRDGLRMNSADEEKILEWIS
jgi:flavodoxin